MAEAAKDQKHHSEGHGFYLSVKAQYEEMNNAAIARGDKNPPGIPILTQGSLRLEQYIVPTTNQYTFPILTGGVTATTPNVLANEIRLEQNDNFHPHSIGMYLAVTTTPVDVGFRLMTNPNAVTLGSDAISTNYMALWSGMLAMTVNQVQVTTTWPTSDHYYVPQTQRLSAAPFSNYDELEMLTKGKKKMEPSVMLSGAYTNIINLNLNGAINLALAGNLSRIVLVYYGLRAQNAAIRK